MSDSNQSIRIRIKPVKKTVEKRKLPAKIEKRYPLKLLVAYILSPVVEQLRRYAGTDKNYELGGILVGNVGRASGRLFIEIKDFIPAHKGISHRASFEFTNEAQQEIHEILEANYKEFLIVGWFHTHPGYGIFLSSADQFIDQNYFKEKYHVALVLDPCRPGVEVGAFAWNAKKQRVRVPLFEL